MNRNIGTGYRYRDTIVSTEIKECLKRNDYGVKFNSSINFYTIYYMYELHVYVQILSKQCLSVKESYFE